MVNLKKLTCIFHDSHRFLLTILENISSLSYKKALSYNQDNEGEKAEIILLPPNAYMKEEEEKLVIHWIGQVVCHVVFTGNGTYSYWAKNMENGEEFTGDNVSIHYLFPIKLLELLIQK